MAIGFCLSFGAYAQKLIVLDYTTLQPVSLVSIDLGKGEIPFKTNELGEFQFTNIDSKTVVTLKHPWYQTEQLEWGAIQANKGVVYLKERVKSFDEVVISASRFEEKSKDVAQSIEVIRKTDLENMNQSSTADVMMNSGKVFVQKSQLGGGSPVIRGFETNKVLMVVDGVRMNNAIYRGGHIQNIITMDNAALDKVEIVFGAGSVVYGSDALGGVMHFYTKNPYLSTGEKLLVKGGAYARYNSAATGFSSNATISVGGKRFGSLSSFSYNNFDDLRQGAKREPAYNSFGNRTFYVERINGKDSVLVNKDTNLQIGSGYQQYDILQKFLFKQNDKVNHVLNFQYSTSSDVPRYDRLTQTSGGTAKFAEWYYGPQERLFASYALSLSNKNKFYDQGRIILAYQAIEESRNDRRLNKNDLNSQIETVGIYSANADFSKDLGEHELRYGAEFYYNDVQSKAYATDIVTGTKKNIVTRYPNGGSSMQGTAVYLTHTWEVSPKFIINDGLRFTNVNLHAKFSDKTFFPFPFEEITQQSTALNGNLGLIFMPTESWRFTGIFSTGFRAPNVDDLSKVFESTPGRIIVPNPDIKPEYTYNSEFGISKTFNKKVTLSAVGYYTWYKNAITTRPSTFDGQDSILYAGSMSQVISAQNAAEAYLFGLESNLNAAITDNFSITSSLTYTYARFKTDTTDYPMDHIPPVFGRTGFNLKQKKFRGEFFVVYSGWKLLKDYNLKSGEDNEANATPDGMPAWFTLNARVAYQFNKYLNLQVACENILDRNYRIFASNISAPGRNFIVTLRCNF